MDALIKIMSKQRINPTQFIGTGNIHGHFITGTDALGGDKFRVRVRLERMKDEIDRIKKERLYSH